ncbi:MAG: hypothetical protein ACOC44_19780 [Promethearchaeia archaeon]
MDSLDITINVHHVQGKEKTLFHVTRARVAPAKGLVKVGHDGQA